MLPLRLTRSIILLLFALICMVMIVMIVMVPQENRHQYHLDYNRALSLIFPGIEPEDSICFDYRTLNLTQLHSHHNHTKVHPKKVHTSLTEEDVEGVKRFIFFIGYPRSGHSIIGTMMDAHPNMIIAHEYHLFYNWHKSPLKHSHKTVLYNRLYRKSVLNSMSGGWRSEDRAQKGYTLNMDYRWQGKFTNLKVIGDKSGASTLNLFADNPQRFWEILEGLRNTTRVPICVMHVIRNPYDMISTRLLYTDGNKTKIPATVKRKHCDYDLLNYAINRTFNMISSVQSLKDKMNLRVLDVHHADLVRAPRYTMTMICAFLDLSCPEDFLDACEKKVYKKVPKSRLLVTWSNEMIEEVYQLSKPYKFLWRYSFASD